jgi:thiol-disulfide isomerase/thioredoxin
MRYLFFITLSLGILFSFSCNKTTSSSTSSKSANERHQVSKVYNIFDEFAHRLTARSDDETVYVVNFWATWCTQCRKEIPGMVKLDRNFKNDKKVKILFVNLDAANRQRLVPAYLRNHNITGEVVALTDPNQEEWIDTIDKKWEGSLPGTLFFKGDKHRKFYGYPLSYAELERNIGFMKVKK